MIRPDCSAEPTAPSRLRGAGRSLLLAAATLLLCACSAPGMKLNMDAGRRSTVSRIDGLDVTLHPINPQTVKARGARAASTENLEALLAEKPSAYQVGTGDVLLVTVWEHPELTQPLGQFRTDAATGQVVDEEGHIFFPHVGMLPVRGLTVAQIRTSLVTQLSRVLKNPQIDVKITSFRSKKVYISGEVKSPGLLYATDVPFTLAEAVTRAGGVLPSGDDSRLLLTRGERAWSLNFHELMGRGGRHSQIQLKDGDTVRVPGRDEETVYLLGEMRNPRAMPLFHGRLSLARALAETGGIEQLSSNAHSIYVIRAGHSESAVDVFHLDSRNPTALVMADRFELQPRDIVFVDAGTLVRWNRVVSLILPTFQTLAGSAANVKNLQ